MSKQDLENKIKEIKTKLGTMSQEDEDYDNLVNQVAELQTQLDNWEDNADNTSEEQEDPVEKAVQERLKQMKENMDRMAKERDAALKEKARLEQEKKQAEIARLEEEGKFKEAAEMKAAELEAKLKFLEEENTKLTRDSILQASLAGLDFRNDRSRDMAYRDIVSELVQNDSGQWVHKSGTSIQDFVVSYSKDENNSFLFRVKSNTGAGTNTSAGAPDMSEKKNIMQLSSTEVLELARKGQLGNFKY